MLQYIDLLVQNYKGKYLIISKALDAHVFNTIAEAYRFGAKTYGLGNFLLQEYDEKADKVQIITNLDKTFSMETIY